MVFYKSLIYIYMQINIIIIKNYATLLWYVYYAFKFETLYFEFIFELYVAFDFINDSFIC